MDQLHVASINCHFEIPKIGALTEMWSPEFMVRGIPWKIKVYKKIYEEKQSLAIYLFCAKIDKSSNWSHAASVSFKLRSFAKNVEAVERQVKPYIFDDSGLGFGNSTFIAWDDLFDAEKNYVKNDTIQLDIEIKAADPNEATKSNLICANVEKCCDEGCLATFRLTVANIENLMAVRTKELILRNIAWYLTVYKSHSGHIEMRLETKSSTKDFPCKVRMSCKLVSTKENAKNIESIETKNMKRSSSMFCKEIISWDELLKTQNGYVENGSVVFEVELKVNKPEGAIANNINRNANGAKDEEKLLKIECAICFENVRNKEVSSVPCGHMFCSVCIAEAIKARKRCPKCNAPANLEDLRRIYLDNLN